MAGKAENRFYGNVFPGLSLIHISGIGIAIAPYTSAILSIDPGLVIRRLTFTAFIPWVRLVWNPSCQLSSEALAFMNMI